RRELSRKIIKLFYQPYILHLERVKKYLNSLDDSFDPHGAVSEPRGIKSYLIKFVRKYRRVYHIYSLVDVINF
ncbi:MAG: hypothetical protein ACYCOO_11055, partial [Chitinophagaceae bacterium]